MFTVTAASRKKKVQIISREKSLKLLRMERMWSSDDNRNNDDDGDGASEGMSSWIELFN